MNERRHPPAESVDPRLFFALAGAIILACLLAGAVGATDLALPPERLIPARERPADAPDPSKGQDAGKAGGPNAPKSKVVKESTASGGMDNALGGTSVTTRRTRVGGGNAGIVPPSIRMPRMDVPQAPPPVVPAPRAPSVRPPRPPRGAGLAEPAGRDRRTTAPQGIWRTLEPGMEYAELPFMPVSYEDILFDEDAGPPDPVLLSVVRIDPARFDFELCAAAKDGASLPLGRWADRRGLAAAINAGMYLPDGRTSTGYLRQGAYVNNGRVGARLGAFFLAGPDILGHVAGLPEAMVADRDAVNVAKLQKRYRLVIQNYRIIDERRRIVWAPDGRRTAVAAVAGDGGGRILFMLCQEPVETHVLARHLLNLPLDVRTVMYVEGGAQAGMLVRAGAVLSERYGRSAVSLLMGVAATAPPLPNVLGARRRAGARAAGASDEKASRRP